MSDEQIEYKIIKYTKISQSVRRILTKMVVKKEVRTGLFIVAPGLVFPAQGKEEFWWGEQETILTTTDKQHAIDVWIGFHTVLSEQEYMDIKTAHLGHTLGNERVSSEYLNIKKKYRKGGFFIQNPLTKRVEKSVSVFIAEQAKLAAGAIEGLEDDVRVKHHLTDMALECLIGYSPNPTIAARQNYFDILHETINSGGRTVWSRDAMYDVVESVWARMSKRHRNAWRYSRYLNNSTFIGLLNRNVKSAVCMFFNLQSELMQRTRLEEASMPKGHFVRQ